MLSSLFILLNAYKANHKLHKFANVQKRLAILLKVATSFFISLSFVMIPRLSNTQYPQKPTLAPIYNSREISSGLFWALFKISSSFLISLRNLNSLNNFRASLMFSKRDLNLFAISVLVFR